MRRLLLWGPPIVYMGLIFHLSSESAPLPEVTTIVSDKLLHFVEYGILGVLFYRAFTGERLNWVVAAMLSLIATSAYAASDEWHQMSVPLRIADLSDWVADTAGAAIAIVAYTMIGRRR
jgi:VanZ family protein